MQTIDIRLNVPNTGTYSLEEFVAKVKSYAERLVKKNQVKKEDYEYEPNEETKAAIREAQEHIAAIENGTISANDNVVDTSSVEAMLKSCGL